MNQEPDRVVSKQLDPEESLAAIRDMAKKNKNAANETSLMQSIEEQMKVLDQRSEEFRREVYGQLESNRQQFEEQRNAQQTMQASQQLLQQQMEKMIEMMKSLTQASNPASPHISPVQPTKQINLGGNGGKGILPTPPVVNVNGLSVSENVQMGQSSLRAGNSQTHSFFGNSNFGNRMPNIELTNFEGGNLKSWIRKCEKYFQIFAIPDEQKIDLATLYLGEKLISGIKVGKFSIRATLGKNLVRNFVNDLARLW